VSSQFDHRVQRQSERDGYRRERERDFAFGCVAYGLYVN
jgi:hypothetical protein